MSTSTSAATSPPLTNGRVDKMKKQKKIVILRLPPATLAQFLPKSPLKDTKDTPSLVSTPDIVVDEPPAIKQSSSIDNPSDSNSTPAPPTDAATPADPPKKRKGPMPGYKRNLGVGADGLPKPRGKPGPKKKPRLEDGTIDHSGTKTAFGANAGIAAHKLGPKANQGAINAGLRALDRSGKPCRQWDRKAFQLKSFTGVVWGIPSWKAPPKSAYANGDDDSEMNDVSQQSSSDIKPNDSSTAMESNTGDQAEPMVMSTPAASSPVATPAVVAALG